MMVLVLGACASYSHQKSIWDKEIAGQRPRWLNEVQIGDEIEFKVSSSHYFYRGKILEIDVNGFNLETNPNEQLKVKFASLISLKLVQERSIIQLRGIINQADLDSIAVGDQIRFSRINERILKGAQVTEITNDTLWLERNNKELPIPYVDIKKIKF